VAALLLVTACGCGSGLATVSGKVTYQDRPVTYGSVIFLGPDEKAASAAIGEDGSYKVEGITPGEARIGVISRDPAKGRTPRKAEGKGGDGKQEAGGWFPLPRDFESPTGSGLTCPLKAGPNTHNIELK
jgi:hypothetical protein